MIIIPGSEKQVIQLTMIFLHYIQKKRSFLIQMNKDHLFQLFNYLIQVQNKANTHTHAHKNDRRL